MRALSLPLFLIAASPTFATPQEQQNLLVLLADDVGVDSVACYAEGDDVPSTPNIDALAAEGVLFRNVWGNPSCSPARVSLQTGRFGHRTGVGAPVVGNGHAMPLSELTLPELFDMHPELGYSHAFFGKWHIGSNEVGGPMAPNMAGWDHYAGALDNLKDPYDYYHWQLTVDGDQEIVDEYITTRTVDMALAWLETAPEPWVCVVSFHAAHYPYHSPPAQLHSVALPQVDPREEPRPFFRAIVEAMDNEMGRLLNGLGDRRERTTIVFASDNGTTKEVVLPPFSPLRAKLTPYEGGIGVPLIVTGPLVDRPGREVEHLVCLADIYATLAEAAQIDVTTTIPGVSLDSRSFLPVVQDPAASPARIAAYSTHFAPNGFDPEKQIHIMRDARYKLILQDVPVENAEMYDLRLDPFEQQDLLELPLLSFEQRSAYLSLRERIDRLIE